MKQRYLLEVHYDGRDAYSNNFKCWVHVTDCAVPDNQPNRSFRRRGYGKFIGNFSPIWITIGGIRKQLTEWKKVTCV